MAPHQRPSLGPQVQHQPDGGVAAGQQPAAEQGGVHPGAHHPGRTAAAGQEEDVPGRRGHLRPLHRTHHAAGETSPEHQVHTRPLRREGTHR